MQSIQSVTGFIGKNTDILELSGPTHFNRIGFELYEDIPSKRAIKINNEIIYILPEQTLEIEDIEITSLQTADEDMYLNITYSLAAAAECITI